MAHQQAKTEAKRKASEKLTSGFRGTMIFLFGISGIINILALTGAFYMMQIYDRALTSGSIPTLLAISALAIGLYFFQGLFDIVRSQILVRVGATLDRKIAPAAHRVSIDMPRFGFSTSEALERGRDVDTVRGFLGSQGPMALFDLPWVPIFLIFVYMLHPLLGALTLTGAVVLTSLTIVTEIMTRRLNGASRDTLIKRNAIANSNARNAEILRAMGISGRALRRFTSANEEHLDLQTRTNDITGTFGAISRVLRMILQSAVLGLGAFLTIQGHLSAGAIIAASVASARALAPIDLAIGNWKNVILARTAFDRLKETVAILDQVKAPLDLPAPTKSLKVENLTVAAPGSGRVLLSDVSFEVPGGPGGRRDRPERRRQVDAGAGAHRHLARAARQRQARRCRILRSGTRKSLAVHVGYLPQEYVLLDATIADNISRLEADPDPRGIVLAGRHAGVHEHDRADARRLPYRTRPAGHCAVRRAATAPGPCPRTL